MRILVTGGAGFIGANLVEKLLSNGNDVIVIDNLSRGKEEFLKYSKWGNKLQFSSLNLLDKDAVFSLIEEYTKSAPLDAVWHLAANSDIPAGVADASVDLRDTFMTTFNVLEIMKKFSIPKLFFASSSAIYGDLGDQALHEHIGPLFPISNYGAMKLASEAIISAAAESYLQEVYLFRFPNVIGVPATHGVMLDFVHKLAANPLRLDVLGDGSQQKSYLHVSDLIDAMLFIEDRSKNKINCFNIGPVDEGITVKEIAHIVVQEVSPSAEIVFGKGNKGWVGDVSKFVYSTKALQSLGWKPTMSSYAAVKRAIAEIVIQEKNV